MRRLTGKSELLWPALVLLAIGLANAYLAFVHRDSTFEFLFDALFAAVGLAGCAVIVALMRRDDQR